MNFLTKAKSEKWLQIVLVVFLSITFVMTTIGSTIHYIDHNEWTMGDWLINYSGGWVRRGFLGEVFITLSAMTSANPGFYVALSQILFYLAYFIFSFLLIKKQKSIIPFALLIFSPFIFTFQVNDFQGGYRKEIIYFAVLSFIAWVRLRFPHQKFEKIFILTLIAYPLVILTHEILFLFIPYIVLIYTFDKPISLKLIRFIGLLILPSSLAFIFSVMHPGSIGNIIAIYQSLTDAGYSVSKQDGAILALQYGAKYWSKIVNSFIETRGYIYIYILFLGLSLVAFIPVRPQLQAVLAKSHGKALVVSSLIATLFVAMVAIDWGRFIYMHLVSFFILSLLAATTNLPTVKNDQKKPSILILTLFFIWSLFWHIPHCCGQPIVVKGLTDLNSYHLIVKPVYELYTRLEKSE